MFSLFHLKKKNLIAIESIKIGTRTKDAAGNQPGYNLVHPGSWFQAIQVKTCLNTESSQNGH